MARTGRPRAEIDARQFENLCKMQCTEREICSWFGITDKTLTAWCKRTYHKTFSEVFKEKREAGKISLRRTQFQLAEKSPAMAIFLGKQYLGQQERPHEAQDSFENTIGTFFDALNDKLNENKPTAPVGGDGDGD